MTLHCFCSGELLRDPERRTAKSGNAFAAALLRVDAETVVSLTVFDEVLVERLMTLRKGSALACSGRLRAEPYAAQDGKLRAGLAVTVAELMVAGVPPAKAAPRARRAPQGERAGAGGAPFEDELP